MKRMNWRDISTDYAKVYNDFRGDFSPRTIRYLLKQAGLPRRGSRVLDLATGTGAVLRQLAAPGRFLAGMDASILMLKQNASLPYPGNPRPPLVCADGQKLPLAHDCLDLVTIGQAIHWFDLPVLFADLLRVLRPGGWLAVLSRYPSPAGRMTALVEQTRYPFTAEGQAGIPAWTSLQAPSNLLGLEEAGFTEYTRRVFPNPMTISLDGYLSGMTDRAGRAGIPLENHLAYQARLRETLLPLAVDGRLREPFFDYLFMAQKPGK